MSIATRANVASAQSGLRTGRQFACGIAAIAIVAGMPVATAVGEEPNVDTMRRGKAVYERGCVSCHGIDAEGAMPGVPDLTATGGPLSKGDAVLLKSLREGVQSPGSTMAMPPKGGNPTLTDGDLHDVLEYLRRTFIPATR